MNIRISVAMSVCASALLLMGGCGGGGATSSATKNANVLPKVTQDAPPIGASGEPIDPTKKTIVVEGEVPEAAPVDQNLADLQQASAATAQQIRGQIDSYAADIHSGGSTANMSEALSADLDDYKSQALQTFKAQRQGAEQTASTSQ